MTVQNPNIQRINNQPNLHHIKSGFRTVVPITMLVVLSLTLLLSARLTVALTIDNVTIHDLVSDDKSVLEDVQVLVSGNSLPSLLFSLPTGADQIDVNGIGVRKENGTVVIPLSCSTCNFTVRYHIPSAAATLSSDFFSFSRTISLPTSPTNLHYEIALPPGNVIGSINTQDPAIVPTASEIQTDGQYIIVVWDQKNPQLPQNFQVLYRTHENTQNIWAEIQTETSEWMVWAFAIIALIVGFILGMVIYRNFFIRFDEKSLPYIPASLLSPDEKIILRTIKQHHGQLTQKDLGKNLNWSKSKVSAIMTGLERKEIVKREKIGRNFKLEVIKEIEI